MNDSQNELLKFREQILDDHKKSNKMVEEVIKLAKNQYQYDPNKITSLIEHL
jgi:predicted outer membrane protein